MINGATHLEKRCEWKNDVKKLSIQLFFVPFYGESVKLTSKTLKFTSKSAKLTSKWLKLT